MRRRLRHADEGGGQRTMSELARALDGNDRTLDRYRLDVCDTVGPAWDAVVAGFADACLEQTAAYMGARWGASRLVGLVLREAAAGEAVAAALAIIAILPMLRLGLAYVKFGPLWRRRGHAADPGVLTAALAAVRRVFAAERG